MKFAIPDNFRDFFLLSFMVFPLYKYVEHLNITNMDMIESHNERILGFLSLVVKDINETNSSKEKQERLAKYAGGPLLDDFHEVLRWGLKQAYSPYIKFGVTSEQVKKWMATHKEPDMFAEKYTVGTILKMLENREVTGHNALKLISDSLMGLTENSREVFYNILDKNLKIRMDAKSINKVIPGLIPVFEVSLCNVYADRKHKVNFEKDEWYASRKLDGCRCITIVYGNGDIRCFSRQGKEFTTLDIIKKQLANYPMTATVFDGEMCIVDDEGNEDFKSIMKEITRKNHTIMNPRYKVFDMMTLDEFEAQHCDRTFQERYNELCSWFDTYYKTAMPEYLDLVEMVKINNEEHFNSLFAQAESNNWEGLVIRKNDTTICKRSDSMLKVKAFADAEYIVESTENGPFRVIKEGKEVEEEVMTNAYITHKGNKVSVGSGWSLEQRRFYKEHPEELIGKTITVQYFEETTDKDGNISLRFPTCKYVYENGREI